MSLAVYELATNAVKYGALSNHDGTVTLTWQAAPDGQFSLRWQERGGPAAIPPARRGFGSRLTDTFVPGYFSGSATTDFDHEGILY